MPPSALPLAAVAVLALSVSACGSNSSSTPAPGSSSSAPTGAAFASQSVDAIQAAAKADTTAAPSFHLMAAVTDASGGTQLDLQLDNKGDCTGSVTVGDGSGQILGTGGQYWVKPDDALYTALGGDASVLAAASGKWIPNTDVASFCSTAGFFDDSTSTDGPQPSGSPTLGGTQTVGGQEVVQVVQPFDDGGTGTLSVLTSSPHYLVQLDESGGTQTVQATLSDFGAPVSVTAPTADEIYDPSTAGN